MNDFTKDELRILSFALYHHCNNFPAKTADELKNLLRQLDLMIENYQPRCPSSHEFYEKLVCEQCGQIEDL